MQAKGGALSRKSYGRALVFLLTAALALALAGAASAERYVVLYKQQAVPADAASTIQRAGGSVIAAYNEIGVLIAWSDSASFRTNLMRDARIDGASSTAAFGSQLKPVEVTGHDEQAPELPNEPAEDADTFSVFQWDMRQIHAPEAHAITGGSPAVVVGDIDTGLDKDHPDLVENIDFTRSASCETGAPDQNPEAWDDRNGHGTHTAGTIAADDNGIGIVGVAPNVKVAGIKSSNDDGFFFPEMVICSFYWAGGGAFTVPGGPTIPATVGPRVDVTNNSYFADPFLYNCRNDPLQRAIWKAEKRAIDFAQSRGVVHFASLGNDSDDRAHPAFDVISPDFPPGTEEEREITNACVVIPVEVDGVVGVSAVGNFRQTDEDDDPNDFLKSFYSSYGVGVTEVTAPGGDSIFGVTPEAAPFGRVLSTWPLEAFCAANPARRMEDAGPPVSAYCWHQGTSMASPHAAGVAALIISRFGDLDNPQNGKMRPSAVAAYVQQTADAQPCPTALPPGYEAFTRPHFADEEGEPQECQGGPGYTSWYGNGQVNALRAVLHDAGQ
jgi:lantibiotic leader peptide-processing serine protease